MTRYSLTASQAIIDASCTIKPGPGVEATVAKDLVEGEVVEALDELGVGLRERRDPAGEQLVVVAPCGVADGQGCSCSLRPGESGVTSFWDETWMITGTAVGCLRTNTRRPGN
jgi:hypothetical protein